MLKIDEARLKDEKVKETACNMLADVAIRLAFPWENPEVSGLETSGGLSTPGISLAFKFSWLATTLLQLGALVVDQKALEEDANEDYGSKALFEFVDRNFTTLLDFHNRICEHMADTIEKNANDWQDAALTATALRTNYELDSEVPDSFCYSPKCYKDEEFRNAVKNALRICALQVAVPTDNSERQDTRWWEKLDRRSPSLYEGTLLTILVFPTVALLNAVYVLRKAGVASPDWRIQDVVRASIRNVAKNFEEIENYVQDTIFSMFPDHQLTCLTNSPNAKKWIN